jgi:hypothetical protein
VENTFLGTITGGLGNEIADVTGSDVAGRLGANATRQLATTGNLNLTGLASGELGRAVGSEIADETGSDLAGKAASTVAKNVVQGKDATSGLLNLGINEGVNSAFGAASSLFDAPKAETAKDIIEETNGPDTDVDTTTPDALDKEKPVGGLAAVTATPDIVVDTKDDSETTPVAVIPDDLTKVTKTDEVSTPTTVKPTAEEHTDDILAKIDEITSPETKKDTVVTEDLLTPKVTSTTTEETPTGGLNIIQKAQEEEPKVDAETGEVKAATTPSTLPLAGSGLATGLLKSNITQALNKSVAPKKPAGGLKTALKPVTTVKKPAPPKMDISKLIPIAKAPVKPTAPKGNLTPVTNIAGLTSMLKKAG